MSRSRRRSRNDRTSLDQLDGELPVIRLYAATGPGIIVLGPSGVVYSNQTGHLSCFQSADQGWYIPLDAYLDGLNKKLSEVFHQLAQYDPAGPMRVEHADRIDELLATFKTTEQVKVDRGELAKSHEAWVYVTLPSTGVTTVAADFHPPRLLFDPTDLYSPLLGFGSGHGVLTWPNCD